MPGSRKLGRASDHRMAMLRGLVTYLLENGRIETTVTRAKEVRSMAEKMITIAKEPTLTAKRRVLAFVTKEDVVKKLFDEIAPEYRDRNGGYTRIIRTGQRRGDAAEMCILELVKEDEKAKKPGAKSAGRTGRFGRASRAKKTEETPAAAAPAEEEAEAVETTVEAVEAVEAAPAEPEEATAEE
jgi:large subunit ribosomal protein L17